MAEAILGAEGADMVGCPAPAQLDESVGVTRQAGRTELAVRDMRAAGREMASRLRVSEANEEEGAVPEEAQTVLPVPADRCHREHFWVASGPTQAFPVALRGEPCSHAALLQACKKGG